MALRITPDILPPSRRLESLEVAASYYGCDQRTVRRMIARGELTAYRVGRTRIIRVDMNEVESLLNQVPAAGGAA